MRPALGVRDLSADAPRNGFRWLRAEVIRALADIAAGACGLVFLAAALGKLDGWGEWSRLTEEIPGPAVLGHSVRFAVPAVESAIVVLSFASPTVGLAAGAAVLACFAVAVWLLAPRLSGRECNCFGAIAPARIGPHLAGRNMVLAVLVAGGWWVARRENLQALSFSKVLVIALFGAIALSLDQFRRLRRVARRVSHTLEEIE